MTNEGDIFEQLWRQVINPDTDGNWVIPSIHQTLKRDPFAGLDKSISRLLNIGCSREDLARFGRFPRYEACFAVLYGLNDLDKAMDGKIKNLKKLFLQAVSKWPTPPTKESEFLSTLVSGFYPKSAQESVEDADGQPKKITEPFADAQKSELCLLEAGATRSELNLLDNWHRFEAAYQTLRLIEDSGFETADEVAGFYESLLSSDPTGLEGDSGSWPLPEERPSFRKASDSSAPSANALCFQLKSVRGFCFSPDNRWICGRRSHKQIPIFSAEDGREVAVCASVKWAVQSFDISHDSRKVYSTSRSVLAVHEIPSGKLLHTRKCQNVLGIFCEPFNRAGGPLLVEIQSIARKLVPTFSVLDPDTLEVKRKLEISFPPRWENLVHLAFSPDGRYLALYSSPLGPAMITIWNWPEATLISEFAIPAGCCLSYCWSPDGRYIVAGGPYIIEAMSGKDIWSNPHYESNPKEWAWQVGVSCDGRWLVGGASDSGASDINQERLSVWDFQKLVLIKKLPLPVEKCDGLQFSPDSRLLGMLSGGSSYFWRVNEIIKA